MNWLFFWPQFALLPYGFMLEETGATQWYFKSAATPCAIVFWSAYALLFGLICRKLKLLYTILLSYPAMFLTAFLFYFVLGMFGVVPYLEGP